MITKIKHGGKGFLLTMLKDKNVFITFFLINLQFCHINKYIMSINNNYEHQYEYIIL